MNKSAAVYRRKKHQDLSDGILFIKPIFKEMIWGGNRLQVDFGFEVPGNQIGECWTVSAHPSGDCLVYTVSGNSYYDGKRLSELWKEHRDLFGCKQEEVFPLLMKIIDAKSDLSIQVHPDNLYAAEHEKGALGKSECWYVLDCDPGAQIIIGHQARTKAELVQMVEEKRWSDLIYVRDIHPGDFFQIEPGTVHAIKAGTLILETQQNSDITYRLYDYDRLQNGKPRELQVNKSIDVITCPSSEQPVVRTHSKKKLSEGAYQEKLICCDYYEVERIVIKGSWTFDQQEAYTILGVIRGEGMIDGIAIKKGDHFILPAGYGEYALTGTLEIIKVVR